MPGIAGIGFKRYRIDDVADQHQGRLFKKRVHFGCCGIRNHQHIARIDRLPPPDTRSVEAETILKTRLLQFCRRYGEMLPNTRKIHESAIDHPDVPFFYAFTAVTRSSHDHTSSD